MRLLVALLLVLGGLVGTAGTARADVNPCDNSYVCVSVGTPGKGGGSGSGGGGGGGGGSACRYAGQIMACYVLGIGWLSANDGCYYMEMQPQPPAGDPLWQGNQPGNGAVYTRTCPLNGGGGTVSVWMPAPPPLPPQVSPAELAHLAAARLGVTNATIRTAPRADVRHSGLVGVPVWFWVVQPNGGHDLSFALKSKWYSLTASVPGLWVTAHIYVSGVTWVTGEGDPHCGSKLAAGVPYPGDSALACTYTYQAPNKDYQVQAIVHWHVDWVSSTGATGDFPLNGFQSNTLHLQIEELQVLN